MRVSSSISFKSQRISTWQVDIFTAHLQSPLRQMHDHMKFQLQVAQSMPKYFRNTEQSCKFRQWELNTYLICGPVAAIVGQFNDMWQYINKHCLLPGLYTLLLSTCVHNMHVSPHRYTLPWTVLCIMCLVCVCLNRWVHTYCWTARQTSPAYIHSIKPSLAVKLGFLTIKYSSNLKVMGLYTMLVSRKYVFAVRCLQMHWFKSTTSCRCISCFFSNNLTNVILSPKTKFCDILCSSLLILLLF